MYIAVQSGNRHHSLPIVIQLIRRHSGPYHAQTYSTRHVVADMHKNYSESMT